MVVLRHYQPPEPEPEPDPHQHQQPPDGRDRQRLEQLRECLLMLQPGGSGATGNG